jgi:hypothetical protein
MRTSVKAITLAMMLGTGALALAGCGSSSSGSGSSSAGAQPLHVQKARQAAGGGNADVGSAPVQTAGRGQAVRGRTVVGRAGKVQKARRTPGSSDDDLATRTSALNPCTLVNLSEARAITRGSIKGRAVAPLGPTCIYREPNAKNNITLVVETLSAARVARQMHRPAKLKVSGHAAYCGRLGLQMLLVELSADRLLNVTAPCPVAKQFATVALKRL